MPCYHADDGIFDAPCKQCYIEREMESEELSFTSSVNAALCSCDDDEKALVKGVYYVLSHLSKHVGVAIVGENFRVYRDGVLVNETDTYDQLDVILYDDRYKEAESIVSACDYLD